MMGVGEVACLGFLRLFWRRRLLRLDFRAVDVALDLLVKGMFFVDAWIAKSFEDKVGVVGKVLCDELGLVDFDADD